MFTGSGMPMRFADLDGSMIDVYQAATQMTDESGQSYPFTIDTLLDRALGPEGYYGVFTANMHTDDPSSSGADAIVASAQARGVPVVSSRQMLTWLDGRNNSSFGSITWNSNKLDFTINHASGANGLRAMVPTSSAVGLLTGVKLNGTGIATTTRTIKGHEYAFFDAAPGTYEASYAIDETAPVISNVASAVSGDGTAKISWTTNEDSDSRVDFGTAPDALTASQSTSTLVTSHSVQLSGLSPSTTYYYRVTSADGAANSSTAPAAPAPPSEFTTPAQTFTDTTVADFTAGSADANTLVSQTGDGELILKPTEGDEFSGGPGLPAAWASCPWTAPETCAPGLGATVSGGSLLVDGSYARTVATYGSGRTLEFVASFGNQSFEHAGFGVDLNNSAQLGDLQRQCERRLHRAHQRQRVIDGNAALERPAGLASSLPDRLGCGRRPLLRGRGACRHPPHPLRRDADAPDCQRPHGRRPGALHRLGPHEPLLRAGHVRIACLRRGGGQQRRLGGSELERLDAAKAPVSR